MSRTAAAKSYRRCRPITPELYSGSRALPRTGANSPGHFVSANGSSLLLDDGRGGNSAKHLCVFSSHKYNVPRCLPQVKVELSRCLTPHRARNNQARTIVASEHRFCDMCSLFLFISDRQGSESADVALDFKLIDAQPFPTGRLSNSPSLRGNAGLSLGCREIRER